MTIHSSSMIFAVTDSVQLRIVQHWNAPRMLQNRLSSFSTCYASLLQALMSTFSLRICLLRSKTSIYYSQIMHIATCFDSKESPTGYSLNHILDSSTTVHNLGSQKA